jgi:hypothetical protein
MARTWLRTYLFVALACIAVAVVPSAQAININITYDDQMQDPNSTGTFNVAEKAVISQAVGQWQNAITSAGAVNITVLKSNLQGSLLGFASNYVTNLGDTDHDGWLNGTPTSGMVQVDDRLGPGEIGFWVDPTPGDNNEFQPGNTNYHFTSPAGGACNGLYDMLSLVKHEVAHVLGFSSSFDNFFDVLTPSFVPAEQNRWLYAFRGPPAIGPAAQYKPGIAGQGYANGGVYMREWEDPVSGPGPTPSHIDWYTGLVPPVPPASGIGGVAGFFPDDMMNPALLLGERTIESNVDLDILADAYGYTVIPEPATLSLLALAGVSMLRRRQL